MAVRFAPEAAADLDGIWWYTADASGSTNVADRMIDDLVHQCWLLEKFPQLGRRRDHDLRTGLRSLSVGDYVVLYRIDRVDALILHIFHGNRDIDRLLEEP